MFKLLIILISLNYIHCDAPLHKPNNTGTKLDTTVIQNLFNKTMAEQILGEQAINIKNIVSESEHAKVYQIDFKAKNEDSISKKTGTLYCMAEEFKTTDEADEIYDGIYEANKYHGVEILKWACDEAYFHTDNENFYFVLLRKDKKVYRMKVNKITSKTSLDAFRRFAESICG